MRILHVSEVSWGGVVSLIRQITAQQTGRGHEVRLLSPAMTPEVEEAKHELWHLERGKIHTYPRAYRQLRQAVAEFQPDVVHLHSFLAGFMGRLPGATGPAPVVYQPHSWSFQLRDDKGFRKMLGAWERFAGRRTDLLVTNCQDEINEGYAAGVTTKGRVIGVAVDTDRFAPAEEAVRQRYREQLGVKAPRMLLCVGRLVRQKGQDELVAAWEGEAPPDTELVLLGPGDTEALEALAPRQWDTSIRAVGEHPDVRPWLWASDALVLSSRYEGEAVVVAEAMASGRPVIATNVNGASEAISGGSLPEAGRVVPLGDMSALLAESRTVLDEPGLAADMAVAARRRAEELFSPEVVADRLEAAYAAAIGPVVKLPAQVRRIPPASVSTEKSSQSRL